MEQMAILLLTEADLKLLLKSVKFTRFFALASEDAPYASLEARLDSLHTKIFPKPKGSSPRPKKKRAKKL